jgi:hypothetical protein
MELSQSRIASQRLLYSASSGNPDSARPETALVGGKPIPYEGYYFRILTAQGPNGDDGAKSYIQSGRIAGGFALVAWPARYESTGVMTFIVGPDGEVYQKDLGPQTAHVAGAITTFDPDLTWAGVTPTND